MLRSDDKRYVNSSACFVAAVPHVSVYIARQSIAKPRPAHEREVTA